jgi:hypothetical protein
VQNFASYVKGLRVFENRVLRGTFGPNWDEGEEAGENCIMRSITIYIPRPTLLRRSNHVKRIVVVVVVVVVLLLLLLLLLVSQISLTTAKKHTDIKAALLQGEHHTK